MPFCFSVWFYVFLLHGNFAKGTGSPIQYLLVGFAILIFYLLLLSLSEHLGFDLAYLISTAGVVVLICTYASAILRSFKTGDFRVLGTFNLVWLSLCHSPIGKLCLANGKPRIICQPCTCDVFHPKDRLVFLRLFG